MEKRMSDAIARATWRVIARGLPLEPANLAAELARMYVEAQDKISKGFDREATLQRALDNKKHEELPAL